MAEDALSFTFGKTLQTLFEETGNPVFVWREIGFRIRANEPLPAWVNQYLGDCADRLEAAEAGRLNVKNALPGVFGFDLRRGPGSPLAEIERANRDQQFALEFAAAILRDQRPVDARDSAFNKCARNEDDVDEKTLRTRLTKFFSIAHFGVTATEWKKIVISWLLNHPEYIAFCPPRSRSSTS